jgi:mRNA interferase YafQ
MRRIEYSAQFQRDVKRCEKRGKDISKIKKLIELILDELPLPPRHRDHPLKGSGPAIETHM